MRAGTIACYAENRAVFHSTRVFFPARNANRANLPTPNTMTDSAISESAAAAGTSRRCHKTLANAALNACCVQPLQGQQLDGVTMLNKTVGQTQL